MRRTAGTAEKDEARGGGPRSPALPVLVGWNGLTLHTPEEWSPVAVSAEGQQGYVKVVGPDTRRLEVKWEQPKGVVNVPEALEKYLDRLRKTARRSKMELIVRRKPGGLGRLRPDDQAPIAYTWEATQKAVGCIWHCAHCGRLVIAEVVGDRDDDLSIARSILSGIREHGEDDWITWSLYGLTMSAPVGFTMEKQVLMTGRQQFQLRKGGARLQADRWGLAELALRGGTVQEWYEAHERAALGRYAYRVEETELRGHRAYRLVGRDRWWQALLKLARVPATLTWPCFFMQGYLWHCEASNRIYALIAEQSRRSTLLDSVAARVPCHA